MKFIAIICNVILFIFTCFVLVTDGFPTQANYIVFTIWSQLTRIISAAVIPYIAASNSRLSFHTLEEQKKIDGLSSRNSILRIATILFNVVSFGFVCWALVDQYPHPDEPGFIEFAVLMVVTPIISLVVLFHGGASNLWRSLHLKRKTLEEQNKVDDLAKNQST